MSWKKQDWEALAARVAALEARLEALEEDGRAGGAAFTEAVTGILGYDYAAGRERGRADD